MLTVHAFPDDAGPAGELARCLGAPLKTLEHHRFPDGESLVRANPAGGEVVIYRRLARPDDKLLPLLLAADALRRGGVDRLVLVAPYLPYLRQDIVFRAGESLSRDVFGLMIGPAFDRIVTVEPHMHRTTDLDAAMAGTPTTILSSVEPLAGALGDLPSAAVVVGPDVESTPWAERFGLRLSVPVLTLTKTRFGDRDVRLQINGEADLAGRTALLIDDICASGATLAAAARMLRDAGAADVWVAVAHALHDQEAAKALTEAGVSRLISTDACPHPSNTAPLAKLLAQAVRSEP